MIRPQVVFAILLLVLQPASLTPLPAGPTEHENLQGRQQPESAARALESMISSSGLEAAVAEYRKSVAANERYQAVEKELIALGYRYLQNGRLTEALAVFQITAETFPKSWNAWDSLAEVHLYKDDVDKAEEFYRKSVDLNPENKNGKDRLAWIQGIRLANARETKETLRFADGAKSGIQGAYLGQRLPGKTPEIFAPGVVSSAKAFEFSVTLSPDAKELYFTRRKDGGQNAVMVSRREEHGWTAPKEAAFSKGFPSCEPHITPDGRKLFFGTTRSKPETDKPEYGIWVVERLGDGSWSEPRYHGPGMYVTTAGNGNLYLTDITSIVGRDRPVVVYPWNGTGYRAPERVGGMVNSPAVADHAFIAPDESYILFDSTRPGGQGGEGDLYVCFRNSDGSWGEAINLGDAINSPAVNFCPSVSPDGKYIFYSTFRDIYWVSASILDDLKRK